MPPMATLTAKQILAIRCPTCGAKPYQKCELSTGLPRNTPHKDRRLAVKEHLAKQAIPKRTRVRL